MFNNTIIKSDITLNSLKEEILKINEHVKDLKLHVTMVNHISYTLYEKLSQISIEDGVSFENSQWDTHVLVLSLNNIDIRLRFNDKHTNFPTNYEITKIEE